jgi:hypothetical protein
MKILLTSNTKRFIFSVAAVFLLLLASINVLGYFLDLKYVSVLAAAAEADRYEIRSELLMQAMNEVGVCSPYDAAKVWSDGLIKRSAALQYAVMSRELKDAYAKQLEKTFPNWVTGVSSPWVNEVVIVRSEHPESSAYFFDMKVSTATSTGPAGEYSAFLTVSMEDGFWRIFSIRADKELEVYTGAKLG